MTRLPLIGAAALCLALLAACGASPDAATGAHTASAATMSRAAGLSVGVPTFALSGPRANYTILLTANGLEVTDKTGVEKPVTLPANSRMRFSDQSLSFDVNGPAGQLYRLYRAAFGRTPDAAGLGYWLAVLDRGVPLDTVSQGFLASAEFTSLYGSAATLSNADMIAAFYRNVLGRAGDKAGVDYWIGVLDRGAARSVVVLGFTDSPENRAQVDGTILANGIQYFTPDEPYVGVGAAAKASVSGTPPASASLGATIALPAVLVQDAAGRPLADVKVDFAVGPNNGSLAASSALTDGNGLATVPAWTLGPAPGVQAVTATVAGGLGTRIEVTATVPSGCVGAPAAIGMTYSGAWTSSDCTDSAGLHYDEYTLQVTSQTVFKASLTGHAGRQFAVLDSTGRFLSEMPADPFAPAAADKVEFRYALPAGTYKLRAYTKDASTLGAYTLALSPDFVTTIADPTYCSPIVFTTFGAVIEQSLSKATSCSFQGDIEDRYIVILRQGETVEITMETSTFGPWLGLRDDRTPTSPLLVNQTSATPGTVKVTHTATFSGFHEVIVLSNNYVSSGPYKLSVVKK